MTDPKRLAEIEARVALVRRNGTSRAKDNIAYHLIMHQDIPYLLSKLRARDAEIKSLQADQRERELRIYMHAYGRGWNDGENAVFPAVASQRKAAEKELDAFNASQEKADD